MVHTEGPAQVVLPGVRITHTEHDGTGPCAVAVRQHVPGGGGVDPDRQHQLDELIESRTVHVPGDLPDGVAQRYGIMRVQHLRGEETTADIRDRSAGQIPVMHPEGAPHSREPAHRAHLAQLRGYVLGPAPHGIVVIGQCRQRRERPHDDRRGLGGVRWFRPGVPRSGPLHELKGHQVLEPGGSHVLRGHIADRRGKDEERPVEVMPPHQDVDFSVHPTRRERGPVEQHDRGPALQQPLVQPWMPFFPGNSLSASTSTSYPRSRSPCTTCERTAVA